jgi:hypothetical protein
VWSVCTRTARIAEPQDILSELNRLAKGDKHLHPKFTICANDKKVSVAELTDDPKKHLHAECSLIIHAQSIISCSPLFATQSRASVSKINRDVHSILDSPTDMWLLQNSWTCRHRPSRNGLRADRFVLMANVLVSWKLVDQGRARDGTLT